IPVYRATNLQRWKEEDFRVVKIEAELILEAKPSSVDETRFGESENAYLSSSLRRSRRRYLVLRCSSWRSKWQE
ncbi:hypothetical protein TNCV_2969401, partial [Trichonephila clavipes]